MSEVDCKINLPEDLGPKKALTVGTIFDVVCTGEFPAVDPGALRLQIPEDQKYLFKVLKAEFSSRSELRLEATGYMAGEFNFPELTLTDGTQEIKLKGVKYTIASVIDPQQQPPPEPYGPFGPAPLSLPLWYYFVFAAILGLFVFLIAWRIWVAKRKRDLMIRLKSYDSPLSPMAQFSKELRALSREHLFVSGGEARPGEVPPFLKQLNEAFRIFLIRELLVPALDLKRGKLLKQIFKEHKKVWELAGSKIQEFLAEIERSLEDLDRVKDKDARQLWKKAQACAEAIESAIHREKKS
ncbi:MAG: hypothetical protein AB7O96_07635 [Pseudobdellovibrionaceae bacterium]